jgi:hypothetical protein
MATTLPLPVKTPPLPTRESAARIVLAAAEGGAAANAAAKRGASGAATTSAIEVCLELVTRARAVALWRLLRLCQRSWRTLLISSGGQEAADCESRRVPIGSV